MESIRILQPGDEALLEDFCRRHPDTTLFFRSNALAAGLADRGERLQGTYVAAFEDERIVALAGHFWNENMILEAPVALEVLVAEAVRVSGRAVRGFIGPHDQAVAARAFLGLADVPATLASREILFALDLDALRVPRALAEARWRCRRSGEEDLGLLLDWRVAYNAEALGEPDTPEVRARSEEGTRSGISRGTLWVLEADDALVSMTGFNAITPEAVQVGGVWTPSELRSRGYARGVVAGSLRDARRNGARRSILFTAEDNHAAQACYRGLGYEEVGDFGVILLAAAHRPQV